MTTPGPDADPGHLLPDEEWQRVVEEAEREAERIARGEPAPEAPKQHGRGTGLLALSGIVVAPSAGAVRPGSSPTFGVFHSAETPLAAGYAASLARNWFGISAPTSCHYITDPAETWGVLPDERIAWHVGTGNTNSIGLEQAGRASMTRAQWLVPAGEAQMRRNGAIMRAARTRYGIGLHMMSDADLLRAHRRQIVGGWATHDQCRRVLKGTTHVDPGNFPTDVQIKLAIEGDDVPLTEDEINRIAERVHTRSVPDARGGWGLAPRVAGTDAATQALLTEVQTLRSDLAGLRAVVDRIAGGAG